MSRYFEFQLSTLILHKFSSGTILFNSSMSDLDLPRHDMATFLFCFYYLLIYFCDLCVFRRWDDKGHLAIYQRQGMKQDFQLYLWSAVVFLFASKILLEWVYNCVLYVHCSWFSPSWSWILSTMTLVLRTVMPRMIKWLLRVQKPLLSMWSLIFIFFEWGVVHWYFVFICLCFQITGIMWRLSVQQSLQVSRAWNCWESLFWIW